MFDVHILSINVSIHYISVLIKYFFPVENHLDYDYERERECVCVTGNTYVMADLLPASPAGNRVCRLIRVNTRECKLFQFSA